MPGDAAKIDLSMADLRAVAGYAAACARVVLPIFEATYPNDGRPRTAVTAAQAFADGAKRTKSIRDAAWGALRVAQEARDAGHLVASEAARAALAAAGAAFLHPLAKATQVKHILGSAGHAARAHELLADDPAAGDEYIARACKMAGPAVIAVLMRYPQAPDGGGRVGELIRKLDTDMRRR